ncbi:hypothetical protein FE257_005678 [Aspergillus nanangensis]|uniref:FAD/NAD(P)-binding domain-containing protein n=1 Tax=Aspergillus nanangensis TaxID=2582783 RepID=A0AAD4GV82_ASPNN|nr:hypothetical protein FE257_005678 [Aspergillus nanangensis]
MARVVVVGAGLYGLITAKTYLQIKGAQHPSLYADDLPTCFTTPQAHSDALLIIDSASDLGGTWARERLYPNLLSQNSYGLYEYSDLPLASAVTDSPEDDPDSQFIPGWKINRYLHLWSKKWDLHKHIRLKWKVSSISRLPTKEWKLVITITDVTPRTIVILCDKLVLATGLTTEPNMPATPYMGATTQSSHLPVIHAKQMGEYCRENFGYEPIGPSESHQVHSYRNRTIRSVAIQGGAKSSFDFVHFFASLHRNLPDWHLDSKHSNPVQVHWVIDDRGTGPAWIAPPKAQLPTGAVVPSDKAASTRLIGLLHPCEYDTTPRRPAPGITPVKSEWGPYLEGSRLRNLLHGSRLGRFLVRRVWEGVDREMATLAQYDADAKMDKLRPMQGVIECGSSGGIANQANFWETIRASNVHVHRSRIVAFSGDASKPIAHLQDGTRIPHLDLVVHATGWRPVVPIRFEPPELAQALGLASPLVRTTTIDGEKTPAETRDPWKSLDRDIERDMRHRYPSHVFRTASSSSHRVRDTTPYRLFRRMVSPELVAEGDRSFVAVGVVLTSTIAVVAEVQALWAVAFMTGGLDQTHDEEDKAPQQSIATPLRLNRVTGDCLQRAIAEDVVWGRVTGSGLDVDAIRYNDVLMRDLGLDPYRSGGGFWREFTAIYQPASYKGIVQEYISK